MPRVSVRARARALAKFTDGALLRTIITFAVPR